MQKFGRNDPCWCGSGKKYKKCHCDFDDIIREHELLGEIVPPRSIIKNKEQIAGIRESARINSLVLDYVAERIKEGITTEDIDRWVYERTKELDSIPAPLNYNGYPKSVCTSINEVVCHGIPSKDVVLKDGDIVNVDVSTIHNNYFGDASRMFCIGNVSEEKKKLVEITKQSVYLGLEQVKPWGHLGDIGQVINDLAKANGYSVVREIGGHGIGLEFHEDPWVSYVTKKGTDMLLAPGMIFTIEPMINMGSYKIKTDEQDRWTVRTVDGKPSAQWEIQVLVTETGYEVLSK